jgi:hypothetical protein
VFQVSPLPRELVDEQRALVERLAAFFDALPRELGKHRPLYALELRNGELVTPRLMRMLAAAGVRYCVGLHDRMPLAERQAAALRALDGGLGEGAYQAKGPLVVRWNLHRGFLYQEAKQRYEPFDRLIDEDPETRRTLARLAVDAFRSGQPVWITANNKLLISKGTCKAASKSLEAPNFARGFAVDGETSRRSLRCPATDDARGGPTGKGERQ